MLWGIFFVSNIYTIPNNFWLDNNVKMFRLNKIKVQIYTNFPLIN